MKKIMAIVCAIILSSSSVLFLKSNTANAAMDTFDKVKFGSTIKRTFDKDLDTDVFYISLKKDQTIKVSIKNAKKKKIDLMVMGGIDIAQYKKELAAIEKLEGLDDDAYLEALDKLLDSDNSMSYMDDLKFHAMLSNKTGELSMGPSTMEIALKKGDYVFSAMTESSLSKYGVDYDLSITSTNKKNLEYETNDTIKQAMSIKRSQIYNASMTALFDDEDYYKVTVPEAGNLVVQSTTKQNAKLSYNFYDSKKKKLTKTVKKSGKSYTAQTAVKKGIYYVRVSNNTFENDDMFLNYNLKAFVKTKTPTASVTNKKGTSKDSITVKGLQKGAKVIVYKDAKKKTVLATKTATASTMKINTKKLTDRGGKIYVTVKNKALYTSSMKSVSYKAIK